ncbi:hypothetical protein KJZ99_05395 [bacterium]|nr:hypothetical protein [bacterium]
MRRVTTKLTMRLFVWAVLVLFCGSAGVQAQCGGQITISATSLEWAATGVGVPVQQTVEIMNTGPDNLCIFNVTSTSPAWIVSWNPSPLPPGGVTSLLIDFFPFHDRDYFGTIEIFSSDENSPRDSIKVRGEACQAALPPGAPQIHSSGSPYMFYYSIPWDENPESVEYAIQVRKMPEGDTFYGDPDGGHSEVPVFNLLSVRRGVSGRANQVGAVGELEPSSFYEVRLLTRDCMGNVFEGPPMPVATQSEIHEAAIEELTINATSHGGPVELRWNPQVTDVNQVPLPFDGYFIFAGNHPDSIDQLYAESYDNSIELPAVDSKKLFTVYARTNGTHFGIAPFFFWPPDNAPLYGVNTVMLRDAANWDEWSSVQIQIDSMGFWVDLLSLGPDELPGREGVDIIVDFDQYGVGPRMIQANVTDIQGVVYSVIKMVNVLSRPYAEFSASYDPAMRTFTLLATNISTPVPLVDIWWPLSTVDERYGPAMQFESKLGEPQLHIVKPIPLFASKILNEEQPWPLESDATYGVKVDDNAPGNFQVIGSESPASPCCKDIEVAYFNANTGFDSCFVSCKASGQNPGSKTCRAGCRFYFNILWEWNPGVFNTSWAVHSKYTESHWDGTCAPGPDGPVFTAAEGDARTKTKDFKNQHSYEGATTAVLNSSNTPKPQKQGTNDDGKAYGKTPAWTSDKNGKQAEPVSQHKKDTTLRNGRSMAVRLKGDYYFRVVATDECPSADCDKEYRVNFDIVCCQDCDTIVTTSPSVTAVP